ncbi:MAG: flavodoxin family protein [Treponema sp.]|jgi:multimeric flavodoxin WrbA|nr:flavodoxin family protein [Treponema sp.]
MKVIAFNGSPHKDGVVAAGISVIAGELKKEGIETEVAHIGHLAIHGCTDCRKCRELGRCALSGDPVNEWSGKMQSAQGIILGTPVYYGGIAGTFKSFLDRLFFPGPDMRYKIGASVVSLRRTGGIATFQQLNNYFNLAQMIITPGVYWDIIHGNTPEELSGDKEGIQIMEIQGRNMAWLIKALSAGGKEVPPPPPVTGRKRTNFIH